MGKRANSGINASADLEDEDKLLHRLGSILEDVGLCKQLGSSAGIPALRALTQLAEQAIRMGIDYRTLGVGWNHPSSRTAYRAARHKSITCPASRERAALSQGLLVEAITAVAAGELDAEQAVVGAFIREVGLTAGSSAARSATFSGVAAALNAEILLPLRALNECEMTKTMCGAPLPSADLTRVVLHMTEAVLSREGGFSDWRYSNPKGNEQLRGLSEEQLKIWREPTFIEHSHGLRTHEDGVGELGFFWATKIGGPSHGFDYESQCILPLLANARHKVLLVSDPKWPAHPAGRAHWRFLWSVGPDGKAAPEPRLWLETVNTDFDAEISTNGWEAAVLQHAMAKADAMQVPLSVDSWLKEDLKSAARRSGLGDVREAKERMLLRPSNAIVEASDYLSSEHDWVQDKDEITQLMSRVLYVPSTQR